MIDINELRKVIADCYWPTSPVTINELLDRLEAAEADALEQARLNGMGASREAALIAKLEAAEEDRALFLVEMGRLCAQCDALRLRIKAAEKERDAMRAENERIDEAMESLLIRCDDSDSAMYGTLSTSFVRDTVRIARGAMEESK